MEVNGRRTMGLCAYGPMTEKAEIGEQRQMQRARRFVSPVP
jgi:hypothetical protein